MRDHELITRFGFSFDKHYGSHVDPAKRKMYKKFGFKTRFQSDFSEPLHEYEIINVKPLFQYNRLPQTVGPNKLDHCVIYIKNYLYVAGNHVITGIRTDDDEYYIIDSNEMFRRKCDWRFEENIKKIYKFITSVWYDSIVYINPSHLGTNNIQKPQKTKYNNIKTVVRKTPKMISIVLAEPFVHIGKKLHIM
jgi:hypothetical protein